MGQVEVLAPCADQYTTQHRAAISGRGDCLAPGPAVRAGAVPAAVRAEDGQAN